MSERTDITLPRDGDETVATIPNHSLETRSDASSWSSCDEEANQPAPNAIVNSVSSSSDVRITNNSHIVYNAPVVNYIYRQYDNIEQLPEKTSVKPKNSFSKRFCAILRCKVQQRQCSTKCYIAIPILLLIVVVLIVALIAWLLDSGKSQHSVPNNSDLRIVLRNEWGARPRRNTAVPLKTQPPRLVIINHTRTMLCYFLEQCVVSVKIMQNLHMDPPPIGKGWDDIGYNFLVGGDGLVYEGRGWNVEGSHTLSYNNVSIGVAVIGTFEKEEPTKSQLAATQKLLEYGVESGHISSDYQLFGHRQCKVGSVSPGDSLYRIIKTWEHWEPVCRKTR